MHPPLFIVGAPRSGTSLTRDLLRLCDGLYIPPDETQFFPTIIRRIEGGASGDALASLIDQSAFADHLRRRNIWPSKSELRRIFRGKNAADVLRDLVLAVAVREGVEAVQMWGDKSPQYVFELDLLTETFPGARVLFVVRDPRNTVLSMNRAWGRSIASGSVAWRDAVRAILAPGPCHSKGQVMFLKYEDLTADPATCITEIAEWLGVGFDPARLEGYRGEERWGTAAGRAGVQRGSADSYAQHLSQVQIRRIERIALPEMLAMNYVPSAELTPRDPSRLMLSMMKLVDAAQVVRHYAQERGVREGIGYKWRQWWMARIGRRS